MDDRSLRDIIFSDDADRLPGKTQINFDKAQKFKEACEILDSLQAKGVLTYDAQDPREPYSYHTIGIKFNFEDDYCQQFEASEIAELLSKVDNLLVDGDPVSSDWQLGSRLYNMTD